jgi:hypothetical protein
LGAFSTAQECMESRARRRDKSEDSRKTCGEHVRAKFYVNQAR